MRRNGRAKESVDFARRALKLGQDETIIVPAASILLRAGLTTEARSLASNLGDSPAPAPRVRQDPGGRNCVEGTSAGCRGERVP